MVYYRFFIQIETIAPAHVAYSRVSGVLESLSNTLIPVSPSVLPDTILSHLQIFSQVRGDYPQTEGDVDKKDDNGDANGDEGFFKFYLEDLFTFIPC